MNMKKKMLILFLLTGILFISNLTSINAKIVLEECEYSDEFVKYMKLSDKEKKKTVMPNICKSLKSSYTPHGSALASASQSSFDLRNVNGKSYVTSVKDQGKTNACWAFATNAALESNILINQNKTTDLSEAHIELSEQNTFPQSKYWNPNRKFNDGGNYYLSTSYLLTRRGPALESNFPFSNLTNTISSNTFDVNTLNNKKTSINVNKVTYFSQDNNKSCSNDSITNIKKYLVENGAITTMMYWDNNYVTIDRNTLTVGPYYYYNGNSTANHGVTIVGWDDNISTSKFGNTKPTRNGAFIIKNSYGTSYTDEGYKINMGEGGYFYVSYEDTVICNQLFGFSDVDSTSNIAYYTQEAYLAYNIALKKDEIIKDFTVAPVYVGGRFTKKSTSLEKLSKVSFASPGANMKYDIYYIGTNPFNNANKKISDYTLLASSVTTSAGIESVDVSSKNINVSDDFSIVVKYHELDNDILIPITTKINGTIFDNVNIKSGVSYLSLDGSNWQDTASASFSTNVYAYTEGDASNINDSTNNNVNDNSNNDSNGNIEIKENEKNKVSYINTSDSNEKNPKTSEANGIVVFVIIALGLIISVVVKKKMKKYVK